MTRKIDRPDQKPAPGSAPAHPGPRSLTQRALGGMLWTFSGTGVQVVIQLGVMMALGRLVTPTEFGLFGAAAVVVSLSQIVSQIGVGPAIIQRRELRPDHVRVAITLSCSLGLLLGAIVWYWAPAIAAFYRIPDVEPVLRGVAFLFPLDGMNTVGKSLLSRELRFRLFVQIEILAYVLGYAIVGITMAWLGYGVWALVFANLSQVAVRTAGMYLAVRHPLRPSLDRRAGRDLLGFGFGHSLAQIGTVVSQQGDNLVVGRWMGPAALGVYGRAYNLMVNPASAFGRIVNRVLFPVMAQVQDAPKRLANAYERTSAVVALISLPLSSFLWVVAPEFIPVILGPRWGAVVLPFRMFSISLLFRMSSKISDACTKAAGQVYSRALIQWTYAALVVTAAIIGQRWGLGAVAVGVSIAMCINWLMMAQLARSVTGLSWIRFARAHLPGAALAVVIGLAVALAVHPARSAHLGSIPILIVAALTAAGVLVAASLLHAELFLGEHATWAFQHVNQFIRKRSQRLRHPAAVSESLASARQDSQ